MKLSRLSRLRSTKKNRHATPIQPLSMKLKNLIKDLRTRICKYYGGHTETNSRVRNTCI
jgi:hypothetical protein